MVLVNSKVISVKAESLQLSDAIPSTDPAEATGLSNSKWAINRTEGIATWIGDTRVVPKLHAPGFCNAKTTSGGGILKRANDASPFTHLLLRHVTAHTHNAPSLPATITTRVCLRYQGCPKIVRTGILQRKDDFGRRHSEKGERCISVYSQRAIIASDDHHPCVPAILHRFGDACLNTQGVKIIFIVIQILHSH